MSWLPDGLRKFWRGRGDFVDPSSQGLTRMIASDVRDDSLNLEVYRGKYCEFVVGILIDDTFEVYFDKDKEGPTYSPEEIEKILHMTVPFCINATGNNYMNRLEDEEREQRAREEGRI